MSTGPCILQSCVPLVMTFAPAMCLDLWASETLTLDPTMTISNCMEERVVLRGKLWWETQLFCVPLGVTFTPAEFLGHWALCYSEP